MRRKLSDILRRATGPVLVALLAAAGVAVQAPNAPTAVDLPETTPILGVQGQIHYLPWDAQEFLDILHGQQGSATGIDSPVRLISSIVSALDGNTIAIDHWEDGYDADAIAAPSVTTETLSMDEGQSTVLNNLVDVTNLGDINARGPNQPYYDGGDKLVSTGAIVVTAGGWASGSLSLHAGAAVVREVETYGYQFVSPVGEGMTYPAGESLLGTLWEYVGLVIVAAEDGTTIDIAGTPVTLDEGDSHLVDGGVSIGDTVTADKPVGVFLATGDNAASYEGRLYGLLPTEAWSDSYVTPVGSRAAGPHQTRVFLYNPGTSAITVDYTESGGGSGTVSVPAGGQANRVVPIDQGMRFSSPGNPFYAIQVITTPEEGVGNDASSAHNWGFALTPEPALTPMVVVGYGPGSNDVDATPGPDANDSAVWVAAQADTTIYIDLDADPTTGAISDPDGNGVDFSCSVTELTPVVIKDDGSGSCSSISAYTRAAGTGDNDMTGARIYSVDGVPLAAAWGQVQGAAVAGSPAIDMGTTVIPFPSIDVDKSAEILNDDGDGEAVPGDTIRYTITVSNRGISPVDDLTVNDEVPANVTYVPGSTTAGGNPVTDPGSGTPFPLDEGGLPVPPVLGVGESRTVTYDLLVDDPLPVGVIEIVNEVTLETDYGIYTDTEVVPVAEPGSIGDRVWNDADGDGVQDGGEVGLVGITVTLRNDEGDVVATQDTGVNGAYSFTDVYPGTYTVEIDPADLAPGLAPTYDLDGSATEHIASVVLATNQDRTDVDFGYAPSALTLEKTVYAGHDSGASCPGGELVDGESGDDVTYCFTVTNGGVVPVTGVTIDDPDLGIDETDMVVRAGPGSLALLAPGQSVTVSYDGAIDGDLVNTATATGTVGGQQRSDDDTAEVDELGPGITIEKTAYAGQDDGAGCATATEQVVGLNGDEVTWCFLVTNSGQTSLSAVTVTDPDLGISGSDFVVPLLTVGQSTTLHSEGLIDGDLVNTASVVGTSPGGAQPTDSDTAEVDEIHPAIALAKTVYRGDDNGASCAGGESAYARTGDTVTWCFQLTNTGDVALTNLTVADLPLGIDEGDLTVSAGSLASIAPGASVDLWYESTATTDVANSATATGDAPLGPDVSDSDGADLDVIDPGIDIQKTVVLGHTAGAGCPGADQVADEDGQPVTWCFVVVNTGDITLTDVTVDDPDLGVDQSDLTVLSGSLASLAPGASVVLYLEGSVDGGLSNTATTSASPPVGPDVSDGDSAEVVLNIPAISLSKTVYRGHDGGASCEGVELVVGQAGAPVTWCLRVTNTGDEALDLDLSDPDLPDFPDSADTLAPGESTTFWVEGDIEGDLHNTASVTGTTIAGTVVSDADDAFVDEIDPAITIEKTIYRGHDTGAGCEGVESVEDELGEPVTWCFVVTNSGDAVLTDITVADAVLAADQSDMSVFSGSLVSLAPGASVVLYLEDTVSGDVVNSATATGTAPDGSEPWDADTAGVEMIGPQIGVAKTIVEGPTGNGDGTYTLTYRLRVENAGETRLDDVQLTDNLSTTFEGADGFTVDSVSSEDLTVNWPGYTGTPGGSIELLAGTDSLDLGERGDLLVTLTVTPGDALGPYLNTATANGTSPAGDDVDDSSDSGSGSDPTNPNPGEPGDTGGTDDPVPVTFPEIDLAVTKTVADIRVDAIIAIVDWQIVVTNEGPGDDPGPITVTDELDERLSFISASGEGWDCTDAEQLVTCVWDAPLAAGASTSEIDLQTELTVTDDSEVVNRAHVASTLAESRTDNNDADAAVTADQFGDDGTNPPGTLPRTGATIGGLVLLGLGLVLGGRLLQRRSTLNRPVT